MIYTRNATGHIVELVDQRANRVSFYKLHINTRERIGSIVTMSAIKFFTRYTQ